MPLETELTTALARREELLAVIRDTLVDKLKVRLHPDQVTPDTALFGTGLGLDSIDAVDLVTGIEVRTGLKIPDDWRGRVALRTLNTAVDYLLAVEAHATEVTDA